MKLPNFFFDIRLSIYWQNAFAQILSKSSLVGKDNPSMADFGYNNNSIRNQKKFKPIANGNAVDSGMIALSKEPLP